MISLLNWKKKKDVLDNTIFPRFPYNSMFYNDEKVLLKGKAETILWRSFSEQQRRMIALLNCRKIE